MRDDGFLAQCGGKGGNFPRRFAFLCERDEEIRLGLGGNALVNQMQDSGLNFFGGQHFEGDKLLGERFEHDGILRSRIKVTN